MRHVLLVIILCFIALPPAMAQESIAPKSQAEPAATRIEVDDEANVIRFFIDGQELAVLDEEGLRVKGTVATTDDGPHTPQAAEEGAP